MADINRILKVLRTRFANRGGKEVARQNSGAGIFMENPKGDFTNIGNEVYRPSEGATAVFGSGMENLTPEQKAWLRANMLGRQSDQTFGTHSKINTAPSDFRTDIPVENPRIDNLSPETGFTRSGNLELPNDPRQRLMQILEENAGGTSSDAIAEVNSANIFDQAKRLMQTERAGNNLGEPFDREISGMADRFTKPEMDRLEEELDAFGAAVRQYQPNLANFRLGPQYGSNIRGNFGMMINAADELSSLVNSNQFPLHMDNFPTIKKHLERLKESRTGSDVGNYDANTRPLQTESQYNDRQGLHPAFGMEETTEPTRGAGMAAARRSALRNELPHTSDELRSDPYLDQILEVAPAGDKPDNLRADRLGYDFPTDTTGMEARKASKELQDVIRRSGPVDDAQEQLLNAIQGALRGRSTNDPQVAEIAQVLMNRHMADDVADTATKIESPQKFDALLEDKGISEAPRQADVEFSRTYPELSAQRMQEAQINAGKEKIPEGLVERPRSNVDPSMRNLLEAIEGVVRPEPTQPAENVLLDALRQILDTPHRKAEELK